MYIIIPSSILLPQITILWVISMNSNNEIDLISIKIYEALFSTQAYVTIQGEDHRIYKTKSGLRNINYEGIFFIEQNPLKGSKFAQMAKKGHKIMWGLKQNKYILRVIDGEFNHL